MLEFRFPSPPRLLFNRRPVSRIFASIKATLRLPQTREFLAWCAPALILGLVLRVLLMVQMPHAFYHDDAPDFLTTPDKLLFEHKFELHAKKTFLVPLVFTIPFLLHIPALIFIPVMQHAIGLASVVLIGLLCRLWFTHWKWFLVPLTLLAAANPFFIWYEHTIMAETIFVFTTLLVVVAGTFYALEPTRSRFVWLCVALFLEAGGRPEGKLLFGFGVALLPLLHWREWRAYLPRYGVLLALALTTHFITKTSQAGLLLYTSVARLTPQNLKVAPGFDPYIAPLRTDLQRRWEEKPSFPRVRDRRAVSDAVERYLKESPAAKSVKSHRSVNEFCMKLAAETCKRGFFKLPVHTYHKFRSVASESPSGRLDNTWLFGKQRDAYQDGDRTLRLAPLLTGMPIKTDEQLQRFIDTHYGEVTWFNTLTDRWLAAVNALHFPDQKFREPSGATFVYPGVPLYFLVAGIGVVIAMLRRGKLQPLHIAWGLTILAFFYTIILTANVKPRFRFVFEPFWFLYIALLAETLWLAVKRLVSRK